MRWPFAEAKWPTCCRPVPARHGHPLLLQGVRKATVSANLALTRPGRPLIHLAVRARVTLPLNPKARPRHLLIRLRKDSIPHGSAPSTGKKHVCVLQLANALRKIAVSSMVVRFRCPMANPAGSPTRPWNMLRHHTETAHPLRQLLSRCRLPWRRMLSALRCRPRRP